MDPYFKTGAISYFHCDCFDWLEQRKTHSIHGVVTDPPFGLEYSDRELFHKRNGNRGGVWRLPPAYDGYQRHPLPRFSVLSDNQVGTVITFFHDWATLLYRPLVPGAHVLVASTPMLSHAVSVAIEAAGFERRGEIIRLLNSMRGGDRPKYAHEEFPDVSVMPRGMHEPWLLFRKPFPGRVSENLRRWGTGGLRRPERDRPFRDVIASTRAPQRERNVAPHPSLKPQLFLREVVRAILPLGKGTVLDPFAGSGATLAAAAAVRYRAIGIDHDLASAEMATNAIPLLRSMPLVASPSTNGKTSGHRNADAKVAVVGTNDNGREKSSRPSARR